MLSPNQDIDTRDRRYICGCQLRITANHHGNRLRITLDCLSDHLPAFAVGIIRHGASINNINVSLLVKGYPQITSLPQLFANRLGFVVVDFATERVQGDTFPVHPIKSSSLKFSRAWALANGFAQSHCPLSPPRHDADPACLSEFLRHR